MGGHRIMLIKTDSPISGMPFQEASLRNFRRAAFLQSIFLKMGGRRSFFVKNTPGLLSSALSSSKCRRKENAANDGRGTKGNAQRNGVR